MSKANQSQTLSHYIKPNGYPTQNLTALMQIAVNPNSSENMKKACAHSFRELSDMIHTKNTSDSKKRKLETSKQTTNTKTEYTDAKRVYELPACSSESESDGEECLDTDLHNTLDINNSGAESFFKSGKFK